MFVCWSVPQGRGHAGQQTLRWRVQSERRPFGAAMKNCLY